MNIDYTLWPNTDGNLGNIKVQIPDGVNTFWPEGDALVHNFVYKDGKLAGFVDTKALTVNDSKSTVINYDYVDIELPFTEGEIAITRGERSKYFNVRYNPINDDNVVITLKYKGCKTLDDVITIDPDYLTNDIIDGVWSEGLGDLERGNNGNYNTGMFYYCSTLESFTSDLTNLTNGEYMFYGCENLASFNGNLSNLTRGHGMFHFCFNLESFASDLSSLTNGTYMFSGCKLDIASVQNIADTIKDVNGLTNNCAEGISTTIDIGIGDSIPNEQEEAAFNKIASKGWIVYVVSSNGDYCHSFNNCCGTCCASLTTLDENGEETTAPIPFWAKPVQSDEEHARYVDSEGNFYNILGGNYIYGDDLSTYGMFTSLEDAAAQMRLTKIGEEEIETA